jgi:hypothetical protein
VRTLKVLLAKPHATREAAIDLLAADAFATYMCEAACDHPETLVARADEAIANLVAALPITLET